MRSVLSVPDVRGGAAAQARVCAVDMGTLQIEAVYTSVSRHKPRPVRETGWGGGRLEAVWIGTKCACFVFKITTVQKMAGA